MNLIQRAVLFFGAIALLLVVLFPPKFQREDGEILPAGTRSYLHDQINYKAIQVRGTAVAIVTLLLWLTFSGIAPDRIAKKQLLACSIAVILCTALLGVALFWKEISQALSTPTPQTEGQARTPSPEIAILDKNGKDPAEAILRPVAVPDDIKSEAWQIFHFTNDEALFLQRVNSLNLPNDVKAALWDAKWGNVSQSRIQGEHNLSHALTHPSPESSRSMRPTEPQMQPPQLTNPSLAK